MKNAKNGVGSILKFLTYYNFMRKKISKNKNPNTVPL